MRIMRWLRTVDARLHVRMELAMDPVAGSPERPWTCDIFDVREVSSKRPATFLVDGDGEDAVVRGRGRSPQEAWENAVGSLHGLVLNIIGQGREESHAVPDDIRP